MSSVRFEVLDSDEYFVVEPQRLIVGGYTGRDREAVQEHINELAAIGIAPPASVPTFFLLDPNVITTGPEIVVASDDTSGEIEPVYIRSNGQFYLGVGSDHTDRRIEQQDIPASKAACPKPICPKVIPFMADGDDAIFDQIELTSWVDGECYQQGLLAALLAPPEFMRVMQDNLGDIRGDLVLFGGTLPLLGGEFVMGSSWDLELRLPDGRNLTHHYVTHKGLIHKDPSVPSHQSGA